MDSFPLNMLQAGESALISEVVGEPALVQRLEEMGFRVGCEIEMIRAGDPCMIRLAGQPLPIGLRADSETHILVTTNRSAS